MEEQAVENVAVFCVGNKLSLDDGLAPALYEEVLKIYDMSPGVFFLDVGCMSLDMLSYVESCDVIITVDAIDGTDEPAGTIFRYKPDDIARNMHMRTSLHDLRLADLFDAANLLGYSAEGICLGMQVENGTPADFIVGLTPPVHEALPRLIETLAAELARLGKPFIDKETKEPVTGPRDL